ncbi:MAG: SDR family oxidoreductase [Pseudomonadota bacterium]
MPERRLALITGASAGIGEAFARYYAERRFDVALTARRKDRLDVIAQDIEARRGVAAITIANDLSKPGAVDDILATLQENGRHADVVINNAGYGLPGTFENTSWQDQADFLQVLLTAPCELVHKTLPGMLDRRYGRILNIASLAGFAPGSKGHTLYGAVKAALIKFSQSMNVECESTGVHSTAVCPGFTYSEFHDVNDTRKQMNEMPDFMWQTAEEVVEAAFHASERNQAIVVTGGVNKTLAALTKILPDPLALNLMKGQSAKFRNTDG